MPLQQNKSNPVFEPWTPTPQQSNIPTKLVQHIARPSKQYCVSASLMATKTNKKQPTTSYHVTTTITGQKLGSVNKKENELNSVAMSCITPRHKNYQC